VLTGVVDDFHIGNFGLCPHVGLLQWQGLQSEHNLFVNTSGNCDPAPSHLTFVLAYESSLNIMTEL
jgi:hypothetical protein